MLEVVLTNLATPARDISLMGIHTLDCLPKRIYMQMVAQVEEAHFRHFAFPSFFPCHCCTLLIFVRLCMFLIYVEYRVSSICVHNTTSYSKNKRLSERGGGEEGARDA